MINMPVTDVNLNALYRKGIYRLGDLRQAEERKKAGQLRGGNAGCVTDTGEVYGGCHRVALARLKGIDKGGRGSDTEFYFEGGESNEAVVLKRLAAAWPGEILTQLQGSWTLDDGRLVTYRPDIVLAHPATDGKPALVVELKSLFSIQGALRVWFDDKPGNDHLTQAAFYSLMLGVPAVLLYYSSAKHNMGFDGKRYGTKDRALPPFHKRFYLTFVDDVLHYRVNEDNPTLHRTVITGDGLRRFYSTVSEMDKSGDLGPRVTSQHVTGAAAAYDVCKYCSFYRVCEKYETETAAWLDAAQLMAGGHDI